MLHRLFKNRKKSENFIKFKFLSKNKNYPNGLLAGFYTHGIPHMHINYNLKTKNYQKKYAVEMSNQFYT